MPSPSHSAAASIAGLPRRARPPVPAVARALTLLERLAAQRAPMSLSRLASDLALPKSSVHGLCSTLVSFGYLRRQTDGAFLIGPRVMGLAEAFVAATGAAQEFDALWRDATPAPDETLVLSVLDGAEVVYVAVCHGMRPLALSFNVGMRLPAHLAASGKALLAHAGADAVRRLYADGALPRLTRQGPASLRALLDELAETRARGHSLDDEGVREGVCGIGAAVFGASGAAVAAVALCLHKADDRTALRRRHVRTVRDAAAALSRRLGGSGATAPAGRVAEARP